MPTDHGITTCLSCMFFLGLLAPVVAIAASGASGASGVSSELRVTGRILPGVCQPALGGAGQTDFGAIGHDRFRGIKRLVLPAQLVPFSIKCDVPMRVSVTPSDNQSGSADGQVSEALAQQEESSPAVSPAVSQATAQAADVFGLGHEGAYRLGGYVVRFVQSTLMADGRHVEAITAADGQPWTRRAGGLIRQGMSNAWAEPGATVPGAFGSISGMLHIRPVLNSMEQPGQDARMNGSLTLELEYL